jgi:DNA-binding HxlR family transcriptional regulator
MRYGQFCPIAKAAEIVAERWTPLVVSEMLAGSTHFSDIRRGVPLMSQTLLSKRLKELARVGVVERRGKNPRRPEWHLTQAGRALAPVIQHLGEWGLYYAQDPLEEEDLDVTILTEYPATRQSECVRRSTRHYSIRVY